MPGLQPARRRLPGSRYVMRNRPRPDRCRLEPAIDKVHDPVDADTTLGIVRQFLALVFRQRRIGNLDHERDVGRYGMISAYNVWDRPGRWQDPGTVQRSDGPRSVSLPG